MDFVFIPIPCYIQEQTSGSVVQIDDRVSLITSLVKVGDEAKNRFKVQVDVFPMDESNPVNAKQIAAVCIHGPLKQVQAARLWLMNHHLKQEMLPIPSNSYHLFQTGTFSLKDYVRDRLLEIEEVANVQTRIKIKNSKFCLPPVALIDGPTDATIEVYGSYHGIQKAKLKIIELLAELRDMTIEKYPVSIKAIPLLSGRGKHRFFDIMAAEHVSVFTLDPCPDISVLDTKESDPSHEDSNILLVGKDYSSVKTAWSKVEQLFKAKGSTMKSKSVPIDLKKFQLVVQENHNTLRDILILNATHMKISMLDSDRSKSPELVKMTISGELDSCIENTIKEIVDLCTKFFYLRISLSNSLVTELSKQNVSKAAFVKRFSRMVQRTGCEINVVGSVIVLSGSADAVTEAGRMIKEVEDLQHLIKEVRFSVELAILYKDFITGKKNGKITKIIKGAGVNITFDETMPHQLVMDIFSPVYGKALDGFQQMIQELPAEMKFYVSDVHHKRIIGVGGKNIQSIMKVYGVYVKFMSNEEFGSVGGKCYFDNNVLARTPAKNSANLKSLYHAVMDLIDIEDRNKVIKTVDINLFSHHILYNKRTEIEDSSTTRLSFPDLSSGIQTITIDGPEKSAATATKLVNSAVHVSFGMLFISEKTDITTLKGYNALVSTFDTNAVKLHSAALIKDKFKILVLTMSQATFLSHFHTVRTKILELFKNTGIEVHSLKDAPVEITYHEKKKSAEDSGNDGEASNAKNDSQMFQSMSSISLVDKISGAADSKFTGSAPNLRSLLPESQTPEKKFHPAIGNGGARTSSTSLSKAEGFTTAVDQITSSIPPLINQAPGSSALPNTGVATKKVSVSMMNPYRRSTLNGQGFSDQMFSDGSTVVPSDSDITQYSSDYHDDSDQQSKKGTQGDTLNRKMTPPRISTQIDDETIVHQETVVTETQVSAEFVSSVIKNILPMDSNNRLDLLLDSLDLGKYKQTFLDNDVDFEMFMKLKEEDFKELGLSLGARKKLVTAMEEVKARRDQDVSYRSSSTNPPEPKVILPTVSAPVSPATWYNKSDWNTANTQGSFGYNGGSFSNSFALGPGASKSIPSSPTALATTSNPFSINVAQNASNTSVGQVSPNKTSGFAPALLSPLTSRPFFPAGLGIPKPHSFSSSNTPLIQKSLTTEDPNGKQSQGRPRIHTDPTLYDTKGDNTK